VSRPTQDTANSLQTFVYRAFTSFGLTFQKGSTLFVNHTSQSFYPILAETKTVWAPPISLATTLGITLVLFSYAYLDVSVQRVRYACASPYLQYGRLPHSDICGSPVICTSPQLFAAYHVLLRL
jgi:hypothetical protein